jgi:hypothetical protein
MADARGLRRGAAALVTGVDRGGKINFHLHQNINTIVRGGHAGGEVAPDAAEVEAFIARWRASEGAERASFPSFINEFCALLRIERPQPPTSDAEAVAYRFEYPVKLSGPDGPGTTGRIDLYRKVCFVMEAKQSRLRGQPKEILPAGGPATSRPARRADAAAPIAGLT